MSATAKPNSDGQGGSTSSSSLYSAYSRGTRLYFQIPSEPPQSSEPALQFINDLSTEDYQYAQFVDSLATLNENGQQVGHYEVKITPTHMNATDCFHVEASSEGLIDGVPCGTSIDAMIAVNLETLVQTHHEYVKLENHQLNRRTKIERTREGYQVTKEYLEGEKTDTMSRLFSFGLMEGFISEAANLLLQRVMITKVMPSYFEVVTFDVDSNLCLSTYTSLGDRELPIGEAKVSVTGIQRTIHSDHDLPTTWHTYFMTDGHLILRKQVGSPVTMKVKTLPELIEPEQYLEKPTFQKKPLVWEDDMELYSRYLDRKAALKADCMLYLRDHPDVNHLLADFLQAVLLNKPDDTVAFAASFFSCY